MATSFSKHQLAPVLPANISIRADRNHERPGILSRVRASIRAAGTRYAVRNELNGLSDRELADIGLTRGTVDRVFDPGFAAEYSARG